MNPGVVLVLVGVVIFCGIFLGSAYGIYTLVYAILASTEAWARVVSLIAAVVGGGLVTQGAVALAVLMGIFGVAASRPPNRRF